MKNNDMKYYSLKEILKRDARYNIIFGERSNGKTFSVIEYGLKRFCEKGEQLALVRRWKEDFRGKRSSVMFDSLVSEGRVKQFTNGDFDNITYNSGKWYLSTYNEKINKQILDTKPFAFSFALSDMEHDKSTSYPNITTILFDEMLTRNYYLPDEFVTFMNVVSTIVRHRENVKIFMLGNTVNMYCPYFTEMGLTHVKEMKQGTIDLYNYGESGLKVAVEYADSPNRNKPSDVYFAFNNPKLDMITGGAWELNIYPHLPYKYTPKDVIYTYFIEFNAELLQCEIISKDMDMFTYIHRKTTPIKDYNKDVIYTLEYSPKPNYHRSLLRPVTKLEKKIAFFYKTNKVFYQDNEVGEVVRNYISTADREVLL